MSDADFYGCYNPDHSKAYNQTKCNAAATDSWCCYIDDTCLDNGLCLQTSGSFSNRIGRGACSDSTWSSPACPKYCGDVRPSGNLGIYLALDRQDGAFCCETPYNQTTDKCQTPTGGSSAPFNIPAGNVIYNRTSGASMKAGTLTLADLGMSSNSTTSNSSTATTTVTATTTSNANIVPVAAGIAVPLAVLLIAALLAAGFLFAQNRRLRKEAQESRNAAMTSQQAPPKDYGWRQSVNTPAPMYEYRSDAPTTNWAPAGHNGHVYAKVAPQEANVHEVAGDQIGELPGDKPHAQS